MIENIDSIGPFKLNGPRGLHDPAVKSASQFSSFQGALLLHHPGHARPARGPDLVPSRSRMGCYLTAGGEEPEAAEALGINVARYKLLAMVASCFLTALAGTFYAQFSLYFTRRALQPRHVL